MIWNILTTAPQCEFKAKRELENAHGLDAVVPYETRQRRAMGRGRGNETTCYRVPLMPSYLFVANRRGPLPWRTVMAIREIRGKVAFDGKPATLTDAQMDHVRLMANLMTAEPPRRDSNRHSVSVSDRVRIIAGPFASIETLVEAVGITCVTVSVHMLGSTRRVDIRADQIERAA